MASGLYVWVGVNHTLPAWHDDYADARTVAHTHEACQEAIDRLDLGDFLPERKLLILKGRMHD